MIDFESTDIDRGYVLGRNDMKAEIIKILDGWADEFPALHNARNIILRAVEKIEEKA